MSFIAASDISDHAGHPPIAKGTEVVFRFPYAETSSLRRFQHGVITSTHRHNWKTRRPSICPISVEQSPADRQYGIPIERPNGRVHYMRPDATSFLDMDYCELTVKTNKDGRPLILAADYVQRAIDRFSGILAPTSEKTAIQFNGHLSFGQVGWKFHVPRNNMDVCDTAPVLCLTPPDISRETGIMLIARAYTHIENYRPPHDVAVREQHWLSLCYFASSDVHAIDWDSPDKVRDRRPFSLNGRNFQALRALRNKHGGVVDDAMYQAALNRYGNQRGDLPAFIVAVARDKYAKSQPRW